MFHVELSRGAAEPLEDARAGAREGDGHVYGEAVELRDGGQGIEGREQKEGEAGAGRRSLDGGDHGIDGAEGDTVESGGGGQVFDAAGPDPGWEGKGSDCLAEECGLFTLRFGKRDGQIRAAEGDGQAGGNRRRSRNRAGWRRREGIELRRGSRRSGASLSLLARGWR